MRNGLIVILVWGMFVMLLGQTFMIWRMYKYEMAWCRAEEAKIGLIESYSKISELRNEQLMSILGGE